MFTRSNKDIGGFTKLRIINAVQVAFEKRQKGVSIFCIVLMFGAAGIFYSFMTTPYTGDIQVFMAGVNQVKYQSSSGLLALFAAWDMKGIINRLIFYIVYRCTLIFVEYGNIYTFMVVSKAIYGIFALMTIIVSAWLLPSEKVDRIRFGFIAYFAVFATFTASHMQAEMSVVILGILVFSLLMGESSKRMMLGGAIGSLFLFTKSILVLMFFSVLACVVLVKKQIGIKKISIAFLSFCTFEFLLIIFIYLIYPQELVEMKNAAEFQTTLLSNGSNVPFFDIMSSFINSYFQICVAIPFLTLGLICTIFLLARYLREKETIKIFSIVIAWILPIDIIVISNCYFIYHYFVLVFPCVITIYLYLIYEDISNVIVYYGAGIFAGLGTIACWILKDGTTQVSFINYSTVLVVILHLIVLALLIISGQVDKKVLSIFEFLTLTVAAFFYVNYSSFIAPKSRNMIAMTKSSAKMMKNFPDDFGSEPVLLLDSGTVTFYNDARSYSEYFYNLPMARWKPGKEWDVQRREYDKLMDYNGKYIVYMSWFGLEKYPELQNKIETEYTRLDDSGYWVYSANWNMFQLDTVPDIDSIKSSDSAYILVRSDCIK